MNSTNAAALHPLIERVNLPMELGDIRNRSQVGIPSVSVIIPTLNEAHNLEILLPLLPDWISELIIVDGCSTDNTLDVVKQHCPTAIILTEARKGKGAALRAGFRIASSEIILILDADGSMDPAESIVLVGALIAGADFAKGSRFIQGGGTDDMTLFRMVGNWAFTTAVRVLFGGAYSDLCYGYLAFWAKHRVLLDPPCDGFEIETYLNIRALTSGLKIVEIPSLESPRIYGESHLRAIPDGWRVLKTIVRERISVSPPAAGRTIPG
jgi:glycosyltransferase involved in cell wall biosynthesis